MNKLITKMEYDEWKIHHGTKFLWAYLNNLRERLKEMWASGEIQDVDEMDAKAQAIFITELMEVDYDTIIGVKNGELL